MDGNLVDCHISADDFAKDLNDVIERTKQLLKASEFGRVIQLSKIFPGLVFPCFGVHPLQGFEKAPHSVRIQDLETALPLFQMYRDDIAAVGEVVYCFFEIILNMISFLVKYSSSHFQIFV